MWKIVIPGGINGRFYSVLSSSGRIVAMQITEKKYANIIKIAGEMVFENNSNLMQKAGRKLKTVFERDNLNIDITGLEDYIVHSVVEALFNNGED